MNASHPLTRPHSPYAHHRLQLGLSAYMKGNASATRDSPHLEDAGGDTRLQDAGHHDILSPRRRGSKAHFLAVGNSVSRLYDFFLPVGNSAKKSLTSDVGFRKVGSRQHRHRRRRIEWLVTCNFVGRLDSENCHVVTGQWALGGRWEATSRT